MTDLSRPDLSSVSGSGPAERHQPRFGETSAPAKVAGFGLFGVIVGLGVVLALLVGLAWSATLGSATPAAHPNIIGGSIVLDGTRDITVIDRGTGEPTVQLKDVYLQVGASNYAQIQPVPVQDGTMLVNTSSGAFNLLQPDNYVADPIGGVGLGPLAGSTRAAGYGDGTNAYIVRSGPASTVSLVGSSTVQEAAAEPAGGASGAPTNVTPVGFAKLKGDIPDHAGATVVGDGALWSLLATTHGCTLVSLRPGSRTGATLVQRERARVADCNDAALIGEGATVALATPGRILLWEGGGGATRISVLATAEASSLVPVTGASGTLWYLANGPTGWQVLGVEADGSLQGPRPLHGIAPSADPAPPVVSNGRIYTLARQTSGQPDLWVINPTTGAVGTVKGASTYPIANAQERANTYATADVIGSGPRVVYNNPGGLLAVVVFTDGSHAPLVIRKSDAVTVAASGPASVNTPATAHTRSTSKPGGPRSQTPPPKMPTPPPPEVSATTTCKTTQEKPYAPSDINIAPSPESAQISWSYQLLTEQDCEPQTWSVRVTALGHAPQPSRPLQVINEQDQLDFSGLRPGTSYQAVVTAYINQQSTTSAPVGFTTSAQGADAPTSVTARVDASGDWVVSWTPCDAASCLTPAAQWRVTGTACGSQYVGQPPTVIVGGSTTSTTFDAVALGRLGQSLRFSVEGISASNLPGNPTVGDGCLQSWRPPQRSSITLASSGAASGATVTAHLAVSPGTGDVDTYGSAATEFVYELNNHPVGPPTTSTTATVKGLAAAMTYRPSVVVWPTGHSGASVTVGGAPVKKDLQWSPDLAVTAALTPINANVASLTASFSALQPGAYRTSGTLTCTDRTQPVAGPLDSDHFGFRVNLDEYGGNCTLSLTLYNTQQPDPYGTPSPTLTTDKVYLGTATTYAFQAAYAQKCHRDGLVARCTTDVTVSPNPPVQTLGGTGWTVSASQSRSGCDATVQPMSAPRDVQLTLHNCPIETFSQLVVDVSWTYKGTHEMTRATDIGNPGTVPTTTTTTTSTTSTTTTTTTTTTATTTTTTLLGTPTTPSTLDPGLRSSARGVTARASATPADHRTRTAALVAAAGPAAGPSDPAGGRTLMALVGLLAVAGLAGGIANRRRRRRDRPREECM